MKASQQDPTAQQWGKALVAIVFSTHACGQKIGHLFKGPLHGLWTLKLMDTESQQFPEELATVALPAAGILQRHSLTAAKAGGKCCRARRIVSGRTCRQWTIWCPR